MYLRTTLDFVLTYVLYRIQTIQRPTPTRSTSRILHSLVRACRFRYRRTLRPLIQMRAIMYLRNIDDLDYLVLSCVSFLLLLRLKRT